MLLRPSLGSAFIIQRRRRALRPRQKSRRGRQTSDRRLSLGRDCAGESVAVWRDLPFVVPGQVQAVGPRGSPASMLKKTTRRGFWKGERYEGDFCLAVARAIKL